MWSIVVSALAAPIVKFVGDLLLKWIAKHELAAGQTERAAETAKAASIIAAHVSKNQAADALDKGDL